ncbi:MAG: FHA domain-containing protein [Actinomycetota bacterium]
MSRFALTLLQLGLLVLLYLFIWRAVRSVSTGISGRQPPAPKAAAPPAPPKQRRRKAGGAPRSLVILGKNGKKAATFKLEDQPLEIGRAANCAITVEDTFASQSHARLSPDGEVWVVQDLGSTNGTFLNERRIEGRPQVRAGDRIRIGTTILELRA